MWGLKVFIGVLEAIIGLHVEVEEWFSLHMGVPFVLGLGWEVGEGGRGLFCSSLSCILSLDSRGGAGLDPCCEDWESYVGNVPFPISQVVDIDPAYFLRCLLVFFFLRGGLVLSP